MAFSVLMSVYKNDKAEFLRQAIESILNQKLLPDEIVLVIDGKVALDIKECIQEFEFKYNFMKTIYIANNVGLGEALRIGMLNCSNEIIARMDSDDICIQGRFERQMAILLNNSEVSIVGGSIYEFVGDICNIIDEKTVPLTHDEIVHSFKRRCPMNHMTVMFWKEQVQRAGGYKHWKYDEDFYLWGRMLACGCKFINISEALVLVRVDSNTYKRRGGWEYFKSEALLQKKFHEIGIISICDLCINVLIRLALQILLPSFFREKLYKRFLRKKYFQKLEE